MRIAFRYQCYLLRGITFCGFIFALAPIEYFALCNIVSDIGSIEFYIISLVLSLIIAFRLFKYTSFPFFLHDGEMYLDDNKEKVIFTFERKRKEIHLKAITEVQWLPSKVYHVFKGILIISYIDDRKKIRRLRKH